MNEAVLDNGVLRIVTSSLGGELRSVCSKKSGIEYLWQGDPAFWGGRAPILFPVVGRLNGGKYRLDSVEYELPIHGFARHLEYSEEKFVDGQEQWVRYSARANEETRKAYPFDFELEIEHRLEGNTVATRFTVRNTQASEMYFSIGGHPGIMCPYNKGEVFGDYYLEFAKPENARRLGVVSGGLFFSGEDEPFLRGETTIPLSYELFADDAISLTGLSSREVKLKSKNSSNYISFDFAGFPVLAFWTKDNAPYLCIEPWFGHGDIEGFDGDFRNKRGVLALSPQKEFTCAYAIKVVE